MNRSPKKIRAVTQYVVLLLILLVAICYGCDTKTSQHNKVIKKVKTNRWQTTLVLKGNVKTVFSMAYKIDEDELLSQSTKPSDTIVFQKWDFDKKGKLLSNKLALITDPYLGYKMKYDSKGNELAYYDYLSLDKSGTIYRRDTYGNEIAKFSWRVVINGDSDTDVIEKDSVFTTNYYRTGLLRKSYSVEKGSGYKYTHENNYHYDSNGRLIEKNNIEIINNYYPKIDNVDTTQTKTSYAYKNGKLNSTIKVDSEAHSVSGVEVSSYDDMGRVLRMDTYRGSKINSANLESYGTYSYYTKVIKDPNRIEAYGKDDEIDVIWSYYYILTPKNKIKTAIYFTNYPYANSPQIINYTYSKDGGFEKHAYVMTSTELPNNKYKDKELINRVRTINRKYNKKGFLIKATVKATGKERTYTYKTDSKGNWIYRLTKQKGKPIKVEKRIIYYYYTE